MAESALLNRYSGIVLEKISQAEVNNKKKKEFEEKYNDLCVLKQNLDNYAKIYTILLKHLQAKAANYRSQRKTELEESTTRALRNAFPEEEYEIHIDWDSRGTVPTATLLNAVTVNGKKEFYPPAHINGELAKQMIAYTTICNMCSMLNAKFIGYDECLNSGDDDSLVDIKPLFDKLLEEYQILMIEHKQSLYYNLNRREIRLEKVGMTEEPMSGETKVIEEVDINVES